MTANAARSNVLAFPGKPATKAKPAGRAGNQDRSVNLTDAFIKTICKDSRTIPGRREFKDRTVRKLYVRVSNGVATYSVFTRVAGYANAQRVSLGTNAELNVKSAREAAQLELVKLGAGIRVNEQKRTLRTLTGLHNETVSALLEKYLAEKTIDGRALTANTALKYRGELRYLLGAAFDDSFGKITSAEFTRLYRARCVKRPGVTAGGVVFTTGSVSGAEVAVRAITAVCNYHGIAENPAAELVQKRQVTKTDPRRAKLDDMNAPDLLAWTLHRIDNPRPDDGDGFATFCKVLAVALMTGCRVASILAMRWDWLDLRAGTVAFPAGVLKNQKPWQLPIPDAAVAMLRAHRKTFAGQSEFVFPQPTNPGKSILWRNDFAKALPIECSIHDARKAFALVTARVGSVLALKLLMTHAPGKKDVTFEHYIKTHSWGTLLRDMRPASTAAAADLLAKRGNRATIERLDAFHAKRLKGTRAKRNTRDRAKRAHIRA